MDTTKRKKLEAAGWKVGTPADFLELSAAESALVEFRLRLADALRAHRSARGLSQTEVAQRLGSSQSRVAKMEAGDRSVTVDLMIKALIASGATTDDVVDAMRAPKRKPTPRASKRSAERAVAKKAAAKKKQPRPTKHAHAR